MAGASVLFRAGVQAYRQAIVSEYLLLLSLSSILLEATGGYCVTDWGSCFATDSHSNSQLLCSCTDMGGCADGARAGVKAEGPIAARATQLSPHEARQILGLEKDATLEEVLKVSSFESTCAGLAMSLACDCICPLSAVFTGQLSSKQSVEGG